MLFDLGLAALGVVLLYWGGEGLVRGASGLARRLGWSPMIIGLTVVAFGTSAPELAATLAAAVEGSPAMAFGNVVGSNIANVGLILGAAGLMTVLVAQRRFLTREVPVVLAVSAVMAALCWDGVVERWEGLVLLAGLPAYLALLYFTDRRDRHHGSGSPDGSDGPEAADEDEDAGATPGLGRSLALTTVGIVLLVAGAEALVRGAAEIARDLGVAERIIGITLVAVGTSLPELAAAISAALRREGDLVLGNVFGSNVFNILLILGTTATVRPLHFRAAAGDIDLLVMLGITALACGVLAFRRVGRLGGAVLLTAYGVYVGYLFLL